MNKDNVVLVLGVSVLYVVGTYFKSKPYVRTSSFKTVYTPAVFVHSGLLRTTVRGDYLSIYARRLIFMTPINWRFYGKYLRTSLGETKTVLLPTHRISILPISQHIHCSQFLIGADKNAV